jgi:xanthosine utilization system XapX-like protein
MIFELSAGLLIIGAVLALIKIREPDHRET